MKNSENMDKG